MSLDTARVRSQVVFYLPIACLAASLLVNVVLARVLASSRPKVVKAAAGVAAGTKVHPINARTLDGTPYKIDYPVGQLPLVLYVMDARCGWCERNVDAVRSLTTCTRGRYRVVAVADESDELPHFLKNAMPNYDVYKLAGVDSLATYGVAGTPTTVVVGAGGVVLRSWMGAYRGETAAEMSAFFACSL